MRTIGRDFGDTARKVYAVASGALGNGKTCVVNSDGTVSVIGASDTPTTGSPVVFEQANSQFNSVAFDSNSNRIVVAYRDAGNSNYGTAIVGTVSGTSISFGTAVVFEAANCAEVMATTFDSNSNKVVISYVDAGNSSYGTAIVGTVDSSDNSITFGTAAVFNSGATDYIATTFDSNSNKVVIAYRLVYDRASAKVATVSGTSISFGSATEFNASTTLYISAVFDSNSNKVVLAYRSTGNSNYGTAIVGTVSSTSISFGSAATFESAVSNYISAAFDSNSNKVVVSYSDAGNSNHGTVAVGTVSSTSISFGTPVVFTASEPSLTSTSFDSNSNKVIISYRNEGNSSYGTLIVGTVSGTGISFGTASVFEAAGTTNIGSTFDSSSNSIIIVYRDVGNSNYGTAVVYQQAPLNLTAENYIGITPSAYPDGAAAEIQTKGAVNEEQSGLTAGQSYFVQTDGTLGTTAASPSVFAGTAVSATKIIVKG